MYNIFERYFLSLFWWAIFLLSQNQVPEIFMYYILQYFFPYSYLARDTAVKNIVKIHEMHTVLVAELHVKYVQNIWTSLNRHCLWKLSHIFILNFLTIDIQIQLCMSEIFICLRSFFLIACESSKTKWISKLDAMLNTSMISVLIFYIKSSCLPRN